MTVYAFEPVGFDGELVTVEIDIRRGIPSIDLVGLPDGAVREARERIRAAIRNSAFEFPLDRLLLSLAPAGVPKGGSSFDLAMAFAVLVASGQVPDAPPSAMALGELELSGRVRPVPGVLSAIAAGLRAGIHWFVVPRANLTEASALAGKSALAIDTFRDLAHLAAGMRGVAPLEGYIASTNVMETGRSAPDMVDGVHAREGSPVLPSLDVDFVPSVTEPDMADIRGQRVVRRAMEVAAAGGHHLLLFGPPGTGKSMAARRLAGLLPDLDDDVAVRVTMLHSLAGQLPEFSGLMRRPPFRAPHHGASAEGIVGGGRLRKPGEISLAHGGILLLDEAPEFRTDVLQSLREPLEEGLISISRADRDVSYPSEFMLVLACNPCPCGNLGRKNAVCVCSRDEIRRYWKRLGGPLLDRIDIRVPVEPARADELAEGPGESTAEIRKRVVVARILQERRYSAFSRSGSRLNGRIPAAAIEAYCMPKGDGMTYFVGQSEKEGLSSRASLSVLRVARTLADLEGSAEISIKNLEEAFGYRQYGDGDIFWVVP